MDFERDILQVLSEATNTGMPLRRIALNVYNIRNSLFEPLDQSVVYSEIAEWLRTKSSQSGSPIMKCDKRGYYTLNPNSPQVQQLMMQFTTSEEDEWMM